MVCLTRSESVAFRFRMAPVQVACSSHGVQVVESESAVAPSYIVLLWN